MQNIHLIQSRREQQNWEQIEYDFHTQNHEI